MATLRVKIGKSIVEEKRSTMSVGAFEVKIRLPGTVNPCCITFPIEKVCWKRCQSYRSVQGVTVGDVLRFVASTFEIPEIVEEKYRIYVSPTSSSPGIVTVDSIEVKDLKLDNSVSNTVDLWSITCL
jgi:hypothetical protein